MTLVEFLLQRLDEDEQAAFGTSRAGYSMQPVGDAVGTTVGGARLRAEVAAKRAIIDAYRGRWAVNSDHDDLLRLLAEPFADHDAYREEWRP